MTVACDFLTVETLWLKRIHILFFLSLERRRIELIASTSTPDGAWVIQQARNLLMALDDRQQPLRYLIHDRDGKFSMKEGRDSSFDFWDHLHPLRASSVSSNAGRVERRSFLYCTVSR